MPREVKDTTQVNEKTCDGLTNSEEGHLNKPSPQYPRRTLLSNYPEVNTCEFNVGVGSFR